MAESKLKDRRVSVYFANEKDRDRLERCAIAEHRTASAMAQLMILEGLERRKAK